MYESWINLVLDLMCAEEQVHFSDPPTPTLREWACDTAARSAPRLAPY